MKYVSKEDIALYTNVSTSKLHFNYRCYKWAESIRKFDTTHPFVTEHRFCYRFLEKYYEDYCKKAVSRFVGLRPYVGVMYDNWMRVAVKWWNDCVCALNHCNWGTKRKQLFIYGGTNV